MTDAPHPRPTPPVGETLTGDRACTHCMHPLVGRAIEREPSTELLYVRCGECGAATALMEYPVATPWVQRMKTVVATGLVATAVAAFLILAALAGGFSTGAAMSGATISADRVFGAYTRQDPPSPSGQNAGVWDPADATWLDSPAGVQALAASRRSVETLVPFGTILALGCIAATPCALLIGMIGLRRRARVRMLLALAPIAVGWIVVAGPARIFAASGRFQANWRDAVLEANYLHFAVLAGLCFAIVCTACAILAPHIAATIFRAVLPPRDRRLVAWIWEWRGKPVPKD